MNYCYFVFVLFKDCVNNLMESVKGLKKNLGEKDVSSCLLKFKKSIILWSVDVKMIAIVAEWLKTFLFDMRKAVNRAVGCMTTMLLLLLFVFSRASCHSLEISWRKANFNNRSWQIVSKKRWGVVHGSDVHLPRLLCVIFYRHVDICDPMSLN